MNDRNIRTIAALVIGVVLLASTSPVYGAERKDEKHRAVTVSPPQGIQTRSVAEMRAAGTVPSPASAAAAVEAPNYYLRWSCVAAGGSEVGSGPFRLGISCGQNAASEVTSGTFVMHYGFWQLFGGGTGSCCVGHVGDANGSGEDVPTIGDISIMIDAKFIAGTCVGKISCFTEADINQSGLIEPDCDDITIGDISMLIDYLFITGPENFGPLPECL